MRKVKLILFSALCLFFLVCNINAKCEDEGLNNWAMNATIKYEEDNGYTDSEGNVVREKEYLYLLHLVPYYKGGKVMVSDTYSVSPYEVKYDNLYKSYALGSYVHMDEKTYTFTLYGDSDSACPNEKLRTIEYVVPAYNVYSRTKYCLDNPNEKICKTNDNKMSEVSDKEFVKIVDGKKEEERIKNMTFFEKALEFLKHNWYFIVIPIVLVSAFYAIKIYLYKKKVDKE